MRWRGLPAAGLAFFVASTPSMAPAADMTARQVTELLFKSGPGVVVDLSHKDLSFVDLSGVNFKKASFEGANLHGTIFSDSNLKGANLKGAVLNLATVTRTDFSNANLEGASLLRLGFTASLEPRPKEAPTFAGANLKGARLHSRLDYTDFTGADLSNARFGPEDPKNELLLTARPVMNGANFTKAKLTNADARNTHFKFSRWVEADLTGVNFTGSDLTRADFSGADLTGANFSKTNLYGANFKDVRGLDKVTGLESAVDFDKAMR